MLNLILSGIFELVEEAIEVLFNMFAGIFDFSLDQFARMFPVASELYNYIRAVGLGLVIAIAIVQLCKYFVGPLAKTTEKPQVILLRTFFAVFLVFMAPYVLEQIFNFTGLIFNDFAGLREDSRGIFGLIGDTAEGAGGVEGIVVGGLANGLFEFVTGLGAIGVTFGIVLGIVVIIQFVKMMLEIVERYLMTILLIYSSPLAMSTFTSEATSQILKKWISMFVAQCILLILSVWGCVLFLSVLANSSFASSDSASLGHGASIAPFANPVIALIYAYAIVKIVKRMDNYLQQVGLNAAGMGGMSLLDAVMGAAGAMKMMKGGNKAGANGKGGFFSNIFDLKRHSGLFQGVTGAVANRGNGQGFIRNFVAGAANARGINAFGVGSAVKGGVDGFRAAKEAGGDLVSGAAGFADGVKNPNIYHSLSEANAHNTDMLQQMKLDKENAVKVNNFNKGVHDTTQLSRFSSDEGKIGNSIGAMYRQSLSLSPEDVAKSGMNETISSAVEGRSAVAEAAMKDIADQGGGTFTDDAAVATMRSYAEDRTWKDLNLDDVNWDSAKLDMVRGDQPGHSQFNFSGTYTDSAGQMRAIEISNNDGMLKQKTDKKGNIIPNGSISSSNSKVLYRMAPVAPPNSSKPKPH